MDAGSENLFKDGLDAKNSKPSSKIEVGHKGKTFYSKRRNYHKVGCQQNVQMFDLLRSIDCSKGII
jgi:hypothetical protein